jgi:hypothetical protein
MLPPDLIFRKCETCGAGRKTPSDGDQGAGPFRGRFRPNDRERLERRLSLVTVAATTRICNLLFRRDSTEHGRERSQYRRPCDPERLQLWRFGQPCRLLIIPARKLGLGASYPRRLGRFLARCHFRFGSAFASVGCGFSLLSSADNLPSMYLTTSTSSCKASAVSVAALLDFGSTVSPVRRALGGCSAWSFL